MYLFAENMTMSTVADPNTRKVKRPSVSGMKNRWKREGHHKKTEPFRMRGS